MSKKGFTLIELLVVIVILAIIALVAIPAIVGVINSSKEKTYKEQERSIVTAAKNYIANHSKELPTEGAKKCISVEQLKDAGLLKDQIIKNPVGANYKDFIERDDNFNGGVIVKNSDNTYTYTYVDTCPAGPFNGKVYSVTTDAITTDGRYYANTYTIDDLGQTYDSCSATGKPICLRFTINNDEVTAAEVCFIKNGTEYCLKGFVDGEDFYNQNKSVLQSAFPGVCRDSKNGYGTLLGYRCEISDNNWYMAGTYDEVDAIDGEWSCMYNNEGGAYCIG